MRIPSEVRDQLALQFGVLFPHLNERQQRLALAAEVRLLGYGGVRAVAGAAGVSETTVRKGVFELEGDEDPLPEGRVRRDGGGRKNLALPLNTAGSEPKIFINFPGGASRLPGGRRVGDDHGVVMQLGARKC